MKENSFKKEDQDTNMTLNAWQLQQQLPPARTKAIGGKLKIKDNLMVYLAIANAIESRDRLWSMRHHWLKPNKTIQ